MKILIEEISTGRFLDPRNQWVQSKAHARGFRTSGAAIKFCLGRRMPDVRLLVSFDNSAHDFYLHPFGRDELMARTQSMLARNAPLQQQQPELGAALADMRRTQKELQANKDAASNDSRVNAQQSVA